MQVISLKVFSNLYSCLELLGKLLILRAVAPLGNWGWEKEECPAFFGSWSPFSPQGRFAPRDVWTLSCLLAMPWYLCFAGWISPPRNLNQTSGIPPAWGLHTCPLSVNKPNQGQILSRGPLAGLTEGSEKDHGFRCKEQTLSILRKVKDYSLCSSGGGWMWTRAWVRLG